MVLTSKVAIKVVRSGQILNILWKQNWLVIAGCRRRKRSQRGVQVFWFEKPRKWSCHLLRRDLQTEHSGLDTGNQKFNWVHVIEIQVEMYDRWIYGSENQWRDSGKEYKLCSCHCGTSVFRDLENEKETTKGLRMTDYWKR